MDIKAKIEELISKLKSDPSTMERFKTDPGGAVETLLGVDLPDDTVKQITEGVKAALSADQLSGLADKLKNLF